MSAPSTSQKEKTVVCVVPIASVDSLSTNGQTAGPASGAINVCCRNGERDKKGGEHALAEAMIVLALNDIKTINYKVVWSAKHGEGWRAERAQAAITNAKSAARWLRAGAELDCSRGDLPAYLCGKVMGVDLDVLAEYCERRLARLDIQA